MIQEFVTAEDDWARYWVVVGEDDAIAMKSPVQPNNYYYMMGFKDIKHQLASGQLCQRWNQENEFIPSDEIGEF